MPQLDLGSTVPLPSGSSAPPVLSAVAEARGRQPVLLYFLRSFT